MAILRAQVTFQHDSGLPEDVTMNTFHFLTSSGDQVPIAQAIRDEIHDFYKVANPGTTTVLSSLFSSDLSGLWGVKFYDLSDPTPRQPIYEFDFSSFVPGSSALPEEVALCLSFQGAAVSGANQARRRGRLYIGPFFNTATVITSSGDPNVASNGLAQTMQSCGAFLLAASEAAADWSWAVYSPTNGSAVAVDNGWVDNAWDTQRRRGKAPSSRIVFS